MLSRVRDYRPTWNLNQTEEVAGNYFPVTTSLFIRDQQSQLTLLTDTSQAGTGCVRDGEIEVMVHRRLLQDDGRGVGEPLNETEYVTPYWGAGPQGQHQGRGLVIRGQHFLTFTPPATAASHWRPLMDRLYLPAMPFFQSESTSPGSSFSGIRHLPENLELLTLSRWDADTILLRIGHKYGINEDAKLSQPVDLDLSSVFAMKLVEVNERGLAGTISRKEVVMSRIDWKVQGEEEQVSQETSVPGQTVYTFGPLQIRTFLVKFEPRSGLVFI